MRLPAFLTRPVLDPAIGRAPTRSAPPADVAARTLGEPLEGTNMSLYQSIIPSWWAANGLSSSSSWLPADGRLAERVWVSSRCIQMNAQQIASMPVKFEGTSEPQWVSAPDPHWFPNGIGDALFKIVSDLYGWGYAIVYVTDYYADGYPRTWTVVPACDVDVRAENGARAYYVGQNQLDASRVVQIDRNPGRVHGCSAIAAYAQKAWGLLAAGNQQMSVSQGAVPFGYLKSERKLTEAQSTALQAQWMEKTMSRNGAPPVLPPELAFERLSFDPKDLSLLDSQELDAKALATAFGVPSVLLNMALTGGLTYQNPSALGEMWWRFELRPTAKRIADAFTAQMLPRGQWVWLDAADTFLPLDPTSEEDDPQASNVAAASPAQTSTSPRLAAIGGSR